MDPLDRTLKDWLLQIQKDWELTPAQMAAMTHVSVESFDGWVKDNQAFLQATVPPGMENAVPLISIYKRLVLQHRDSEDQVKWLFTEHADFAGSKLARKSLLGRLLSRKQCAKVARRILLNFVIFLAICEAGSHAILLHGR